MSMMMVPDGSQSSSPRPCVGTGAVSLGLAPAPADIPAAKPQPQCRGPEVRQEERLTARVCCHSAHRQTLVVGGNIRHIRRRMLPSPRPDPCPEPAVKDWRDSTQVAGSPDSHSHNMRVRDSTWVVGTPLVVVVAKGIARLPY